MNYEQNNQQPGQPTLEPHRGTMILVFGVLGLLGMVFLSIMAWVMGTKDLRKMQAGIMDPTGMGNTSTGRILGIIGTFLGIVALIVVGIAIIVGITMYNSEAFEANRSALASDSENYAYQIVQYWKTPAALGGGAQDMANFTVDNLRNQLGWETEKLLNDDGEYGLQVANDSVVITATGVQKKKGESAKVTTTITFPDCNITTEMVKAPN